MKSTPLFLLVALLAATLAKAALDPVVCLNMIVKDESAVIERALQSVVNLIDCYVIVDTGSTDDTAAKITAFFERHGVEGQLHHEPWVNFGANRQHALDLARQFCHQEFGGCDYILFLDADDELVAPDKYAWPKTLDKLAYQLRIDYDTVQYGRVIMIHPRAPCAWSGVVHEALSCQVPVSSELYDSGLYLKIVGGGARSRDPEKYRRDADALAQALALDPHNTRYAFYYAQSLKDAGMLQEAIQAYYNATRMRGAWSEETYYSFMQIGILLESLDPPNATTLARDVARIADCFNKAYAVNPDRLEALFEMSSLYRRHGFYDQCLLVADLGRRMAEHAIDTSSFLFVRRPIYDYLMFDEYAMCAYWTGHYAESRATYDRIIAAGKVPATDLARIQTNRLFSVNMLK